MLTIAAAALTLFWLILAARGPRRVELSPGDVLLRYGSALRILAIVLALLPIAVLVYGVWMQRWRDDVATSLLFLGASLVAGLLLTEAERVQIVLTAEGITRYSPWRGTAYVAWNQVEQVRYSTLNQWFVVTGAGQTIRVSRHLIKVAKFAAQVQARVAPERWGQAASPLRSLAK